MDSKLQELTDKIYTEGVERGRNEANELIAKAQQEAEEIIAKAQAKADEIMENARRKADELDHNTRSELRLFTQQTVNSMRTDITNMVTDKVANNAVKAATDDKTFMQDIIRRMAESWAKEGNVTIEAAKADELTAFFEANAAELLRKGVKIVSSKDNQTEYTIAPEAGGFKVSMGEAELTAYFKEFVRPKLVEMLF